MIQRLNDLASELRSVCFALSRFCVLCLTGRICIVPCACWLGMEYQMLTGGASVMQTARSLPTSPILNGSDALADLTRNLDDQAAHGCAQAAERALPIPGDCTAVCLARGCSAFAC